MEVEDDEWWTACDDWDAPSDFQAGDTKEDCEYRMEMKEISYLENLSNDFFSKTKI